VPVRFQELLQDAEVLGYGGLDPRTSERREELRYSRRRLELDGVGELRRSPIGSSRYSNASVEGPDHAVDGESTLEHRHPEPLLAPLRLRSDLVVGAPHPDRTWRHRRRLDRVVPPGHVLEVREERENVLGRLRIVTMFSNASMDVSIRLPDLPASRDTDFRIGLA
jgi:hypothetical protein